LPERSSLARLAQLIAMPRLIAIERCALRRLRQARGTAIDLASSSTARDAAARRTWMPWIACSLVLLGAAPEAAAIDNDARPDGFAAGTQWQAASANFTVQNGHPAQDARRVVEHCEQWRSRLQEYWCEQETPAWSPKCHVIVHAGGPSYLSAVGPGGGQTYGSSSIAFDAQKHVSRRRIDFRGDSPHGLASLPHEMTHVVVADLLGGRQPPRWADEGMAMLADSQQKQMLHERDLHHGLANRTAFRLGELVAIDAYPHPTRIPAFYGQSASLTAFLALRDDPARFIDFLRQALDQGYDRALRDVYAIDNVGQLERLWHERRTAWQGGYHGVRLVLDEAAIGVARGAE
jgi:hypothetical protein